MTGRSNRERQATETTALALLRPVLKLLFNRGLSRQSLNRLCDTAYVEAAAQKLRAAQEKITLERVAASSGVSLAKVRRLKSVVNEQSEYRAVPLAEQAPLMAAAERVMTGWYADSAFTDDEGHPLPCRQESQRFEALTRRYGNGCQRDQIADLLLSTETVALNDQGEFEPRGRHVLAAPRSEELAHNSLEALVDLARAVQVNEQKCLTGAGALQRTCVNDRIPKPIAPLFRTMIRQTTQSFLESIDDWLVQHEAPEAVSPVSEPLVRLGVGVYVIADE